MVKNLSLSFLPVFYQNYVVLYSQLILPRAANRYVTITEVCLNAIVTDVVLYVESPPAESVFSSWSSVNCTCYLDTHMLIFVFRKLESGRE